MERLVQCVFCVDCHLMLCLSSLVTSHFLPYLGDFSDQSDQKRPSDHEWSGRPFILISVLVCKTGIDTTSPVMIEKGLPNDEFLTSS